MAAYANQGLCRELISFVRQRHVAVVSRQVLAEFERVLIKKLRQSPAAASLEAKELGAHCIVVDDPGKAIRRSRDPADDPILQAALEGDCDWLVSGDKDLVVLKRVQGLPISTPRDFLEALGVEEVHD